MTEVEIDGRLYIGYLFIPALGLELPVQSQWDYPGLKISPCRYVGSTKTDDLVIAAHNYDRHFGRISKLAQGDLVYFTDMDGVQTTYQVMETLILQPTAIEEMTTSGYDLTLFTCTYGGKTRVTVRCDRVEE
jgi:sortase A